MDLARAFDPVDAVDIRRPWRAIRSSASDAVPTGGQGGTRCSTDTVQAAHTPGCLTGSPATASTTSPGASVDGHARETARVEDRPRRFAKTLGVAVDDERRALVVLEATDRLDLIRARGVLDAGLVRLLDEPELLELAPECEVGTIPPAGGLFGLRVMPISPSARIPRSRSTRAATASR
jgi:hypothetical protein